MKEEKTIHILLVEDNPTDVHLFKIFLKTLKCTYKLNVASDGAAATDYLFRRVKRGEAPKPDLVLLDLNLPKKDGHQVLREIKESEDFYCTPVLVLSTSTLERDITRSYELHANCYISKPSDLERYNTVMKAIEDFWIKSVELPTRKLG